MNSEYDHMPVEQLLDLYCDDMLSPEQRERFDRALADDPSLGEQVELQRRVDAVLRGAFDPRTMQTESLTLRRRTLGSQPKLAVAAMLLFAVSIGIIYSHLRSGASVPEEPLAMQTMQDYYDQAVGDGFKPGWICEDDGEFARTFAYRLGQPVLASVMPDGVKLLGLGYGRVLSSRTVTVFAQTKGKPVLVFAEPVTAPRSPAALRPGLNRYRRELGLVVLFEVSPLAEPHLLEHFFVPDGADAADNADAADD